MTDKFAVAAALREIAALLELEGENPFKIRAYENGARAVEAVEDLGALVSGGRLREVKGIGEALARKIADLWLTGTTEVLERLRERHPPGTLELVRVPELGPRKVAALQAALGIRDLAELERACVEGRVRAVKGFGERTEARILEGIRRVVERAADRRVLLADAVAQAEPLLAHLRAGPAAPRVELAGAVRRMRETVSALDLVASSPDPAAVSARLARYPPVAATLVRGEARATVRLASGLEVNLTVGPPEDHAALLLHATGSDGHLAKLRGVARRAGYALGDRGLYRPPPAPREPPPAAALSAPAAGLGVPSGGGIPDPAAKVPAETEADVYRALGLAYVPPELREDAGEVEAALDGSLPADLIRLEDVRGFVHCHTTWSDGRASLEEMARAADALGAEYLAVTDHSRTAGYAGGLDVDRLRRQWDEIDRVQERVRVRLLRGTESDILEDGALDYPDPVLERLDVIVASVHSRMKMDEAAMTRRLVRCMRLPVFKIWGHALGRLLLEREPFACRVEEVLDALAASRGAVEVNGDPRRLELEPRWLRAATARRIPVVLSVDAHSVADLRFLRWAVATARRGWVRRGEVLNALPEPAFRAAVRPFA